MSNGFPFLNEDRTKSGYVPMDTFPIEGDPIPVGYRGWLLLLDEMNSAAPAVQAAAYKVVLDKEVGQHRLHPRVAIIAAGNLATDRAIVHPMSTAMQSRMVHFELEVRSDDWVAWAHENEVDYRVISYVNFKPGMLHNFDPTHNDNTFPCPRTWEFLSDIIKPWKQIDPRKIPVLAGSVGEGAAREFFTFVKIFDNLPTLEAILANPEGHSIPDEPSIQFALSGMFTERANVGNIDDLMKFVKRMPIEFYVITIRGLVARKRELLQNAVMQKAISDLSRELM